MERPESERAPESGLHLKSVGETRRFNTILSMRNEPDIDLYRIRPHEGSQHRAWEELVFQLWSSKPQEGIEVRKTRAPDSGVEWYIVYPDGHTEGFQAKFYDSLSDSLCGMDRSVSAVCEKHPEMTKLTFFVPFDFTDTGKGQRKSDQDRWEDKVNKWRNSVTGASEIAFEIVRGGHVKERLARLENSSLRALWFGELELSPHWFERRIADAKAQAGQRYTPEAETSTHLDELLSAVSGCPTIMNDLIESAEALAGEVSNCAELLPRHRDELRNGADELLHLAKSAGQTENYSKPILWSNPEPWVNKLDESVSTIIDVISAANKEKLQRTAKSISEDTLKAATDLERLLGNRATSAYIKRTLIVHGPAGQGKTHSLVGMVDSAVRSGQPALVIFGSWLGQGYWWNEVAARLNLSGVDFDDFLMAMNSLAAASSQRAIIAIDALNESSNLSSWGDELRSIIENVGRFDHLCLVVSYRSEFQEMFETGADVPSVKHPGFAGSAKQALDAYCELYGLVPPVSTLDTPLLKNPLLLKLSCESAASENSKSLEVLGRHAIFETSIKTKTKKINDSLSLSPSDNRVGEAISLVADRIFESGGDSALLAEIEPAVNELLPNRDEYPRTLFRKMVEFGILEVSYKPGKVETVRFLFQAVSDHLLATRLLERMFGRQLESIDPKLVEHPDLWPAAALILAERYDTELSEVISADVNPNWFHRGVADSLMQRSTSTFTDRARVLLEEGLQDTKWRDLYVNCACALSYREGHPANSVWLTECLFSMEMSDRDSFWGVATYFIADASDEFNNVVSLLSEGRGETGEKEQRFLAVQFLVWLLASPNRFLRDRISKLVANLWRRDREMNLRVLAGFHGVNDPYIVERLLTCTYGALLGQTEPDQTDVLIVDYVSECYRPDAICDVLARDSLRGIIRWSRAYPELFDRDVKDFEPPYGLDFPNEPLSVAEIKSKYGKHEGDDGTTSRRAESILMSALPNFGDFAVKIVRGDVNSFRIEGQQVRGAEELASRAIHTAYELEEFSCRWVTQRAIEFGWTSEKFGEFEHGHDLRRGRDSHKPERFGKKYQWIAHRELIARLADNLEMKTEFFSYYEPTCQGPWQFYLRDLDPTLPPSEIENGVAGCPLGKDEAGFFRSGSLSAPDFSIECSNSEWVEVTSDLPGWQELMSYRDAEENEWVRLRANAEWHEENDRLHPFEWRFNRRQYHLLGAWLVEKGRGLGLADFLAFRGLMNHPLPFSTAFTQAYLGETSGAPVFGGQTRSDDRDNIRDPRNGDEWDYEPAFREYLWEGGMIDCSLDRSVNIYCPSNKLIGSSSWVPGTAAWASNGVRFAQYIDDSGERNGRNELVVERGWLTERLAELGLDLVIGCLTEREAIDRDGQAAKEIVAAEYIYTGVVTAAGDLIGEGPHLVDQEARNRILTNSRANGDNTGLLDELNTLCSRYRAQDETETRP